MGGHPHNTSLDLDGMVCLDLVESFGTDLALTPHYGQEDYSISFDHLSYFDETNTNFMWYDSEEASPLSDEDSGLDFSDHQLEVDFSQNRVLKLVGRNIELSSDRLDPFTAVSLTSDNLPKDLASFYLKCCPKTTNGYNTLLKHYPECVDLAIPLTTPACFHVAQAQSAWLRLLTLKSMSEIERRELEIRMIQHKGEAINAIRKMHDKPQSIKGREADELLASTTCLGLLERSMGSDESAFMHFTAARRMLKSIGGPLNIESTLLSNVMVNVECAEGTMSQSYVWDQTDFSKVLINLNSFFARIYNLSKSLQSRILIAKAVTNKGTKRRSIKENKNQKAFVEPLHTFGPYQGSVLRGSFDRVAHDPHNVTQQDQRELISQLMNALILCSVILDHSLDQKILHSYVNKIYTMIEEAQLRDQPSDSITWLLQIQDHSEQHSKRLWQVASWLWLLKHVNYGVQCTIKNHVLTFLYGNALKKAFKLDSFHFSYAC